MPLQNRVTPYGEIVALPGRGSVMGNRGSIHDDRRRIVRAHAVRRWIACLLEFRGRRRPIMEPGRYTELFFLDEAVAFSAGHRPCAECRRADYVRFRDLWKSVCASDAGADAMDLVLHAQRLDGTRKRTYATPVASLPDGAFVSLDGGAWLVRGTQLHEWSGAGYARARERPRGGDADVLTPRSIVDIFAAGYRPAVHPSAG